MALFVCRHATVQAVQFDGTRDSALAAAQVFPGQVALDVRLEGGLLSLSVDALGRPALLPVPQGSWLTQPLVFGCVSVLSDELFRALHEPCPTSPA